MNEHIALIWKKLAHLARMREYLRYSLAQASVLMPIRNWQNLAPLTAVLLYMEKLGCIESAQAWKLTRELRNAINHEYEEDTGILSEFFQNLIQATPELFHWHDQLLVFCNKTYPPQTPCA